MRMRTRAIIYDLVLLLFEKALPNPSWPEPQPHYLTLTPASSSTSQ